MEKRTYGKTGKQLSVLGFGGMIVMNESAANASGFVARAIERGINYFDVAPGYGNAEEVLGPALRPYRDDVFLACKTSQRAAKETTAELHRSLQRLQTDHFDLYQLHGVASLEEAERILAPGGALETFVAAREAGLVHHLGFSAHSEEAALRLLDAFPFDSMLLPIHLFSWREGGFGARACAKALEKGAAILALKALAKRPWREGESRNWPKCWYAPIDTLPEAKAALAFTLSQRGVVAAVCPSHMELLDLACDAIEALGETPWEAPAKTAAVGEPLFTATA